MGEYEQNMSRAEFLRISYILMSKKIHTLKEIETKKRRGKLPLPSLKEKLSITTNILEAIRLMISSIDFVDENSNSFAERLNFIGLNIGKGNINEDADQYYENALKMIQKLLLE